MTPIEYPDPALQDPSVILRPWMHEDLKGIVAEYNDPDFVRFYDQPTPFTLDMATEDLEKQEDRRRSGDGIFLAVTAVDDGRLLGGVHVFDLKHWPGTAQMGYWVAAAERGRGIATRSIRLLAGWAFHSLKVERIEAKTLPDNVASQRAAERAGFVYEGLFVRSWRSGVDA